MPSNCRANGVFRAVFGVVGRGPVGGQQLGALLCGVCSRLFVNGAIPQHSYRLGAMQLLASIRLCICLWDLVLITRGRSAAGASVNAVKGAVGDHAEPVCRCKITSS